MYNNALKAVVRHSDPDTGEIVVVIPSFGDSDWSVSKIGRSNDGGTWQVPSPGEVIWVWASDDNGSHVIWLGAGSTRGYTQSEVDSIVTDVNDYVDAVAPGRRNMIDNASFLVCQRGVSASTPHGTNLAATADRWRIRVEVPSGAPTMEMASAEVAYPGGLGRGLRFKTTAGSKPTLAAGDYVIIAQSVEGLTMRQCGLFADTRTIYPSVISFLAYSEGVAGRYIAELVFGFQAGPNADSISLPFDLPANAWTRVVLPVPGHSFSDDLRTGDTTGASLYLWCAAGSNYSGGSALNNTFTLEPTSNTRAVGQLNTLGAAGRAIHFADMQWEVGVRPTRFERLNYDDDLYRCYRYFQRFNQSAGAGSNRFYATGMCNSTSAALFYMPTRRRMRTTPTVTVSAASTFQIMHGGSVTAASTIGTSTDSNSPDGIRLGATIGSAAFTAGGGAILRAANGNAEVDLSAEL